jgi:class 3 adenylate cyclase
MSCVTGHDAGLDMVAGRSGGREHMQRYVRSFSAPDEVVEIETVRSEMVTLGGMTASHDTHQPGWRWSTHVRPLVQTEWCQTRHIGVVLRGRIGYLLEDGTTFEAGPLDLMDIPPGHDAWVIGDEPLETIAWTGARGWLAPLETMADRVLATVLFTDIVDSTGAALRLGHTSWADTLASLEVRTRETIERYRGRLVKTTGDGVLATFDGAGRAVRCAVALGGVARDLGLEIRAAVHTGEIEWTGTDIRGVAIHEASRVLGLAGPGEVLVSAVTAGLAVGAGIGFEDRGEQTLRGIEGPRRIFAVA